MVFLAPRTGAGACPCRCGNRIPLRGGQAATPDRHGGLGQARGPVPTAPLSRSASYGKIWGIMKSMLFNTPLSWVFFLFYSPFKGGQGGLVFLGPRTGAGASDRHRGLSAAVTPWRSGNIFVPPPASAAFAAHFPAFGVPPETTDRISCARSGETAIAARSTGIDRPGERRLSGGIRREGEGKGGGCCIFRRNAPSVFRRTRAAREPPLQKRKPVHLGAVEKPSSIGLET